MHGGEEKNEGRDSDELVRKEKRKFVGEVVGRWRGGGQANGGTAICIYLYLA